MIKWRANVPNGTQVIGLGLEAGNIERLMDGKPILVRGNELGLPCDVYIHYGKTKADMIEELRKHGLGEDQITEAANSYKKKHGVLP